MIKNFEPRIREEDIFSKEEKDDYKRDQRVRFVEFLNGMLSPDPAQRPHIETILNYPQMQDFLIMPDSETGVSEDNFAQREMQSMNFEIQSRKENVFQNH